MARHTIDWKKVYLEVVRELHYRRGKFEKIQKKEVDILLDKV